MVKKLELRKLLRGGLSGEEAGKLVLQDNWLADRGQEGYLSQRDMSAIKSSLKTSHDIEVYNSYIRLYELVDYTLKDARIYALEAESYLMWLDKKLTNLLQKSAHNWSLLFDIPAVVTQKQYDELSQKQRELLLEAPVSLVEVLESRAEALPKPEEKQSWPEEWRPAIQEIQQLITEGKLTPLRVKDSKDIREFYKRDVDYQPAEDTVERLDAWLAGELSEEEVDNFIELTAFIGEELYQTGLPEWIEWIDTYKPNLDEMTAARPEGMMQAMRAAIIQQPEPEEIDERGYYIEKDIFSSKELPDLEKEKEDIEVFLKAVKSRIKSFLAIQAVMDAISQITGIDFSEDLRQWYREVEAIVTVFNATVDGLFLSAHGWYEDLGLGDYNKPYQLKIGRLKPTVKSLRYYQERMAIALGDAWMREAVKSLEYEEAEEGSLAHEVSQELSEEKGITAKEMAEELEKRAKEAKHG